MTGIRRAQAKYPGTSSVGAPGPHTHAETDLPDASTVAQGVTRLATVAEHTAGLLDTVAATPAGVKAVRDALLATILGPGAPAALDTLDELAAALADDSNFAATVTAALATKALDSAVVHKSLAETVTGVKTWAAAQVHTYQGSTPATPPAGHATGPYFGADGLPYFLTPTGVVVPISIGDTSGALHLNPDFEAVTGGQPDNWSSTWKNGAGSVATETTDVLFGSRSLTVNVTGANGDWQTIESSVFTVAPGELVDVGAWARRVTGNGRAQFGLTTRPSGTPAFLDGETTNQFGDVQALTAAFARYSSTFTVPAGHTVARLWVTFFGPVGGGAVVSRIDKTFSRRTGAGSTVLPGGSWTKEACDVATTGAVTVAGGAPNSVDGVAAFVGMRILRHAESTKSGHGIYVCTTVGSGANGTWVRASDAATAAQLAGARVAVKSGTKHGGSEWSTSFMSTDTLGTTDMVWFKNIDRADCSQDATSADVTPIGTANSTLTGLSIDAENPNVDAVYLVDIDADVSFAGAQANIVELLVDGVAVTSPVLVTQSSATGNRQSGHKRWLVTGLSPGTRTFTARTRNTAAGTNASVRAANTVMTVQRVA